MIEEHWAGDEKLLNALKKISETSDSLTWKTPSKIICLVDLLKHLKRALHVKS